MRPWKYQKENGPVLKVLITGITGFAGSHLAQLLSRRSGVTLAGISLSEPSSEFDILMDDQSPAVYPCDLTDHERTAEVMLLERPDVVVHLAARSQVAGAWRDAAEILRSNILGTQALMQAVHETVPQARVLLVSSSEVYGKARREEMPLSEESALKPCNPYSVSKLSQEYVGSQYHEAFGTDVIIARPFNHLGPRQTGDFVVPAFARQIAEIEAGQRPPVIITGNLEAARDFTDVRDTVRAYELLMDEGRAGEVYNIASGKPVVIRDILELLIKLSRVKPEIEMDPEMMRPSDIPVVAGDSRKLRSLGNWQPDISLKQSLSDTLDYWRNQVGAAS